LLELKVQVGDLCTKLLIGDRWHFPLFQRLHQKLQVLTHLLADNRRLLLLI